MNCKPGDLAIITLPSKNAGMIVEVIRPARGDHFSGLFAWFVRSAGTPLNTRKKDGSLTIRGEAAAPDAWLRPVSGLPVDEDVTEDLKEPA